MKECVLWSHHLLATGKRKDIVNWASELQLYGISKPGYPGIIIVEGIEASVDEFVYRIKVGSFTTIHLRVDADLCATATELASPSSAPRAHHAARHTAECTGSSGMGGQESFKVVESVFGGQDWGAGGRDDVDGGGAVSECWTGGGFPRCVEDCEMIHYRIFSISSVNPHRSKWKNGACETTGKVNDVEIESNLPDRFESPPGFASTTIMLSASRRAVLPTLRASSRGYKELAFGNSGRQKLLAGVEQLAKAVSYVVSPSYRHT